MRKKKITEKNFIEDKQDLKREVVYEIDFKYKHLKKYIDSIGKRITYLTELLMNDKELYDFQENGNKHEIAKNLIEELLEEIEALEIGGTLKTENFMLNGLDTIKELRKRKRIKKMSETKQRLKKAREKKLSNKPRIERQLEIEKENLELLYEEVERIYKYEYLVSKGVTLWES